MKQVFHKFVTTDGVLGAYVLDPEYGVFKSHMPPQFSKDRLKQIGRNIEGIVDLARSDFSNPENISFFFEGAALRIQDFNAGYHLISLFSCGMDIDVLNRATDTFVNDFNQAMATSPKLSLVKPSGGDPARKTGMPAAGGLSPEGLMSSETLADPLDRMQSALFKVIGPMAKIVFFNALEQWLALDTPSMESLPVLTGIVSEEIGDVDLANGFKERLPSFCCSPSPLFRKKRTIKKNMKVVNTL